MAKKSGIGDGHPVGGDDLGYDEKGILPAGSLTDHTCDTRLGYRYKKGINPDALPVSGYYGDKGTDGDGPSGYSKGLPAGPPRSGFFSDTDGDWDE